MARKGLQVAQSSERTDTEGKPVGNKILLSISEGDYSSLYPYLGYASLPSHLVLHEAGGKLKFSPWSKAESPRRYLGFRKVSNRVRTMVVDL
jgi:hypothetical protein